MTKNATAWRDRSGSSTATVSGTTDYLTTEAGDELTTETLLEYLILNETTLTPKENTLWDDTTKTTSAWRPRDSGTATVTSTAQDRITVALDNRTTVAGDQRIIATTVITEKTATEWTDA